MPSPPADKHQHSMPFPATSWTRVLRYQGGEETSARTALEDLCRTYWQPVVNYFKALGCDEEASHDAAQEFLVQFATPGQGFDRIDPEKGRLRAYMKQAARHFLSKVREKARAQRRGGGAEALPLDENEPAPAEGDSDAASALYDHSWAMIVLEAAFAALRQDYATRGKGALFDRMRPCMLDPDDGGAQCQKLAEEFKTSTAAMSLEIHRTRKRLARHLRSEVLATVETEAEADEEVRYLLRTLAYGGR
jgi:RNA polymerase sigma-70 factor (ECF subfamily)